MTPMPSIMNGVQHPGGVAAGWLEFGNLAGSESRDICYAAANRRGAVRELSSPGGVAVLVGATNSSVLISLRHGRGSWDVELSDWRWRQIPPPGAGTARSTGIPAGASVPEALVQDVSDELGRLDPVGTTTGTCRKNIEFRLPAGQAGAGVAATAQ
jgi:4-hydroxy-3-methylbut-2-enyl diphosphate reductase IspH